MENTHGKPGRTEDRCRDWKGSFHSVEMTFSLKLNVEKKKIYVCKAHILSM